MFRFRTIIQISILSLILICSLRHTTCARNHRISANVVVRCSWRQSNLNFYRGTTQMLNSTLTTPTAFHRGFGSGFYAALLAEYRPNPVWGGMLYVGYDDRRGLFDDVRTPCNCPMSLSTRISYVSIEPSLRIAPFSSGFYLFAGPRVGFNVAKSFTYIRDGNPGEKREGDWSDMRSTVFSGQVGAGYDISLTSPDARTQVNLSPFVSFQPYFGQNPRSVESWNVTTLRVGAALKFGGGKGHGRGSHFHGW